MPTQDNTGRKYHWWETTRAAPGGDIEQTCRHCGLVSVTTTDSMRPTFRDSHGRTLDITRTPNCPRTPTY